MAAATPAPPTTQRAETPQTRTPRVETAATSSAGPQNQTLIPVADTSRVVFGRRVLAGVLLVGGITAVAVLTSPELVLARVAAVADDPLRLLALLCLLAVVRPLLAWPTSLLSLIAGYGFGLPGTLPAVGLLTVTSVPPYLFGERGRAELLAGDGRLSAAATRLDTAGDRALAVAGPFRSVLVARLAPLPSDVISGAAGVAGVPLWPYLAGTAAGELPWAVAAVVAGTSLHRLAADGLHGVFDVRLVAAAAAAGVLLLVGPVYRHYAAEPTTVDE
jgi:uncharacterized membrane protein YdjX (TVP38/TMEM64 family)